LSALSFELPESLEAREPPEARGLERDDVRLLVSRRAEQRIEHSSFRELPELLRPGDVVVLNVSATLRAATAGRSGDGTALRVHISGPAPGLSEDWRIVELRTADGSRPLRSRAGDRILLEHGAATFELIAPYASSARLMLARLVGRERLDEYLARHATPIRYGYVADGRPLSDYQNAYASVPGSAEMPSAGRPFTPRLLTKLIGRGVLLATITLHTGVSSPERDEPPLPERYEVPEPTAALVSAARAWGGRVIAVGTTVVRALETVARPDGMLEAGSGWTELVVAPERPLRAVDGLITGLHEPNAPHLRLLEAAAGRALLALSYREALAHGYLWHEFGDSHLVLP